ncbi:MAG: outer membrane beta-barrel protein [Bacteroidales bacterium]|nr:outer membrane beta-barrel protein [Bacteroidales bacterium]
MRKKFYFLLFAMMMAFVASAQRFEYQLGLKGGIGAAFMSANDKNIVSKDNGYTYKFGLTGIYYFKENYGIVSGFNIMGSDISYRYEVATVNVKADNIINRSLHNTYLQIPFLLKMRTDAFADKYRVFGEVGYGLDLFVSEQDKGEYDFHHGYRDICSSFILHFGFEMNVLNRSTLLFLVGYDSFFTSMMSMKHDKITMSNLCFEIGFLF